MDDKTNPPDSDQSARHKHNEDADDMTATPDEAIDELQTSSKTGKHSSAQKLAASRPEYGDGRGAQPVDGAFGDPSHGRPNKHNP